MLEAGSQDLLRVYAVGLAPNRTLHVEFSVLTINLPVHVGHEQDSLSLCCVLCFKDPLILYDLNGSQQSSALFWLLRREELRAQMKG